MRIPSVKGIRRLLIGVIILTLGAVLINYLQTWQGRTRKVKTPPPILGSGVKRSVDVIQYFDYHKGGVLRFKINAQRLLETNKNLLEGIEAYDFNPDGSVRNEIRSQKAEYDPDRKVADFSGDVRLLINKRLELKMDSLNYDLNSGVGTTSDLLQFSSEQMKGTARGIRFDQKQQSIDLDSEVDITLVRRWGQKTGTAQPETLHATAQHAFCSEIIGRILFEGNARVDSDAQTLSGEHIEAVLDPGQKRIRSLMAAGNAIYNAKTQDEMRSLGGDSMVFVINRFGTLEKISVSGQASFSSISAVDRQDLQGREIDIEFDAKELPTQIKARTGVKFNMKRGTEQTVISGDQLDAAFIAGTKYLQTIHIKGIAHNIENQAKMLTVATDSNGSELRADDIRMNLRETNGRSAVEKLHAEGSARYVTRPAGRNGNLEPARSLSAAVLEMTESSEGDFFESGSASGKVVILEDSSVPSIGTQMKRLTADRAKFHFYPGNNALKDLDADGNVHIEYEKKNGAAKSSAVDKFRTASEQMRAVFDLQAGKSAVQSVAQWGRFTYSDGVRSASSGRCDYDAGKGVLVLTESPKISDETKETTGNRMEYDQNLKILSVRGRVRSKVFGSEKGTESFFGSASSSSPGIVTAGDMRYWVDSGRVQYTGSVHLLSENQDLRSDSLEFTDGLERVSAQGSIRHLLSRQESPKAALSSAQKPKENVSDLLTTVRSSAMAYLKEKNKITYSGQVTLDSKDIDLSADELDAVPDANGKKIERATARGNVVVHSGARLCKGDVADYQMDSGKFVVTGTPAEVFDPDKGRSFARRLTSSTADDTILLEQ
jgi:LPS export ABC transporter protein LptC